MELNTLIIKGIPPLLNYIRAISGLGVAGVYKPGKGIDELAHWFLRTAARYDWTALFTLIMDEEPAGVAARWLKLSDSLMASRVIIRRGQYQEWSWMQEFYTAVDVVLVNSHSDSWGRVVSEPAALGDLTKMLTW